MLAGRALSQGRLCPNAGSLLPAPAAQARSPGPKAGPAGAPAPRPARTSGSNRRLERAKESLERSGNNRRVRPDRVDRYGELMKGGEWMVSPDAIAFDFTGRLINGQHRLKAIVNSNASAPCLVVWNLAPEAFKISDVGVKRTGADVLRIEGFKNPQELAATCRLIALWKQERLEEMNKYENVENSVIVDVATKCSPRIMDVIEKMNRDKSNLGGESPIMPRSLMAFAYFVFHSSFPERTDYFYNGLVHVKNYPAIDWEKKRGEEGVENPIKMLRDRVMGNYKNLSRKKKLGYLIKAMNYYCHEKPRKRLRYRESDNFPYPECEML